MIIDFAIARRLSSGRDNPKRLLDLVSQELARSALSRAQIKKCAPQEEGILGKLENCAATGDSECRFSKQESDEINQLSE